MEREAQLLTKQTKYDESQDQLNELRGRLDTYEASQRTFEADPVAAIRALVPNIDLKRLAEGLWYENQGDAAPAKYLQEKAATRQNTELSDRLAKLEQGNVAREQAQTENEAQQVRAKYQGSLESYAESVTQETHPLTALMHAKNPQMVSGSMFNIAQNHARQTKGQVLSNEQLADALEKELGYYQLSASATEKVPAPTPAPGTSLRNNSQQVQSDRVEEDEFSDEALFQKGLEAARAAAGQ
jgi:hypothetical protein